MKNAKSGYALTKPFWDFVYQTPACKVQHIALFCWIVELNNKLCWKDQFHLTTIDTMERLSIGNKNTYYNALRDLEEWKFIKIISASKNQYNATIIEICQFKSEPAAGSEVLQQGTQQRSSTDTTSVPIVKLSKPYQTNKNLSKLRESPTREECLTFFSEIKSEKEEAEKFYLHYQARGWLIDGNPVFDWKALAEKWTKNNFKEKNNLNGNNHERPKRANQPIKLTSQADYGSRADL